MITLYNFVCYFHPDDFRKQKVCEVKLFLEEPIRLLPDCYQQDRSISSKHCTVVHSEQFYSLTPHSQARKW